MSAITVLDKNNAPTGPFTRMQVAEKLRTGEFSLESLAFVEGLTQWTPLRDVLARVDAAVIPPVPPLIPPAPPMPVYSYAATMQPPGHLVYAGFWLRVVAHLFDGLVITVPYVALWFVFVMAIIGTSMFAPLLQDNTSQLPPAVAASLVGTGIMLYLTLIFGRILIAWLYHAILESGQHQSTWGKRIVGLKVTSMDGQRISFGHASGRYFATIITTLTMGIGYLMVAFTDHKQALHDILAGTLVVRK